ncbi:PIN domain-containing protein [Shewanella xiamenensis]|uniref:PIN domain-containing protein n=1 Tax=Shewanella xiamenensis TaxID=332186 RepID=UPI0004D92079|nr:PIN domain-containing protein [Shewanella xiamenensis]KEK28597.1 DNA-directed RNA polymerase, beta' subunit [Shewanella xiamenensis]
MFYLFLDTCVLLDISTKKQDLPLVSALEELVAAGMAKLVVTDLVAEEYERNKAKI